MFQPATRHGFAPSAGPPSSPSSVRRSAETDTHAYLGVISSFKDNRFGQVAARLAADEAMHCTALTGALGQSLPAGALTFGA